MIKMTWGNLRDHEFMKVLNSLFEAKNLGLTNAGKLKLLGVEIRKQQVKLNEEFDEILKTYGEEIKDQPGNYNVKPDNRKAYADAVKKLEETTFTCKYMSRLDPVELDRNFKLSGSDLFLLDPILLPLETTKLESVEAGEAIQEPATH